MNCGHGLHVEGPNLDRAVACRSRRVSLWLLTWQQSLTCCNGRSKQLQYLSSYTGSHCSFDTCWILFGNIFICRGLKDLQGFHLSHRNRHCQGMMELEKNLEFICSETAPKNALCFFESLTTRSDYTYFAFIVHRYILDILFVPGLFLKSLPVAIPQSLDVFLCVFRLCSFCTI